MSDEATQPEESTHEAEARQASREHVADRSPTSDEEAAAERALRDPALSGDQSDVGRHYREMAERGSHQEGEGRVP